ncbi:hypothetical protein SAMN05518871_102187 [Psychrobacillus sp. OK028]|uniref:hypothetical protein n=1 Tax=Psychrobacillus sp. OK028 TaxID=1884359 RepID=UPI000887AB3B|nr:hypothetical protein [Psychrobacillus sp. OK028]SDM76332.1 hypothetical protein SAMN05518871_102187 [Psychrobacillus sp. OK028]
MRRAYGVQKLSSYLDTVGYPLTEEEINDLIMNKQIPHLKPMTNMIVFNLDHIDWWNSQKENSPK